MADEEIGIQETTTQDERPSWLPSNFDKPEDLAKSYTHAASKITEQGQELAALRSKIDEIQASQTQQYQQSYQNDVEQQLYDAMESGDGRAMAAANAFLIQQGIEAALKNFSPATPQVNIPTALTVDYAERAVTAEYPDWPEYSAKAREIIQSDPYLSNKLVSQVADPGEVAATLKTAYKLAKAEAFMSQQSEAAATLDELNRQVKNSAQTMSGSNSSEEAVSEWDRIKAARSGIPRFS